MCTQTTYHYTCTHGEYNQITLCGKQPDCSIIRKHKGAETECPNCVKDMVAKDTKENVKFEEVKWGEK